MWNVKGFNALNKRLRIIGLLREWKVDVVCLLETAGKCLKGGGSELIGLQTCGLVLHGIKRGLRWRFVNVG
jgi:hypothetical protein